MGDVADEPKVAQDAGPPVIIIGSGKRTIVFQHASPPPGIAIPLTLSQVALACRSRMV
jgi:hypothetical protein